MGLRFGLRVTLLIQLRDIPQVFGRALGRAAITTFAWTESSLGVEGSVLCLDARLGTAHAP